MTEMIVGLAGGTIVIATIVALIAGRRLRRRARTASDRQAAKRARMFADLKIAEVEYVITQIDRELDRQREAGEDVDRGRAARLWDLKRLLGRVAEMDPAPFSLDEACKRAVDDFRARAGGREVVFKTGGDWNEAVIAGDAELAEWGVGELLANVDHHGGSWSRVLVQLSADKGSAVLTVEDDGDGPDLSTASRLYGPFTPRTDSVGPGLGLFTVFRSVRQMGGQMDHGVGAAGGLLHTIRLPFAAAVGNAVSSPLSAADNR